MIDHAVGNVPDLATSAQYIKAFTGYHEFADTNSADVGTVDSGLNSIVFASDTQRVLLPLNETTDGTKRESQIRTYLEQNGEADGLQHLFLKTDDIFRTVTKIRNAAAGAVGGGGSFFGAVFDLLIRPSDSYYRELPSRLGE